MTMSNAPRTNHRNLGIMLAEPISGTVVSAGIGAALQALANAEPHLRRASMWHTASDAPNEYRSLFDDLVADVQMAKADARLTVEARWADVDKITAAWRTKAEAVVAGLETRVAAWERELTAAARPPAPTADAAVLEAQLANARSDARMVLDQAKTDGDIVARLAEMARGSDAALSYLLLGSEWVATYFRGRGVNVAAISWEHERVKLLAGVLTEKALEAHERLAGIPHARKAATALRMTHGLTIHANPEYFADSRRA